MPSGITLITHRRYLVMRGGKVVKRYSDLEPAADDAAQANRLAKQRGDAPTAHVKIETVQQKRDRVRRTIDEIRKRRDE